MHYQIDKVYYADDMDIYHFILSDLLINHSLRDKLQSIVPHTRHGLEELNSMLCEVIKEKTYQMQK